MMKKKASKYDALMFYVSVAAMILLIYSVSFLAFGSLPQEGLLLVGAAMLFASATASKQKVLQALEVIIIVGVVLGILNLYVIYSLIIVLAVALMMVAYLLSIEHYRKEPIGSVGSIGFILLAIGFAFNNGSNPLVTGFALASGSILIAIYSATSYILYKIRLQVVITILNIVFAVSPMLLFLKTLGV
jgi:hypothetical protein